MAERSPSNRTDDGTLRSGREGDAPHAGDQGNPEGLAGLIDAVQRYSVEADYDSRAVVWRLGEDFAYICRQDLKHPLRFLRQMSGNPPIRLGDRGFRKDLVDDANPARHYIAFVVVGFWLPRPLAEGVLWLWEIAGFVRYSGKWSRADVASGYLGIRHGRQVRREGVQVLPELLIRDLAEPSPDGPGIA